MIAAANVKEGGEPESQDTAVGGPGQSVAPPEEVEEQQQQGEEEEISLGEVSLHDGTVKSLS